MTLERMINYKIILLSAFVTNLLSLTVLIGTIIVLVPTMRRMNRMPQIGLDVKDSTRVTKMLLIERSLTCK